MNDQSQSLAKFLYLYLNLTLLPQVKWEDGSKDIVNDNDLYKMKHCKRKKLFGPKS